MNEKMVPPYINGIPATVPEGPTVLEATRLANFNIPSLCFLRDVNEVDACRICVVEVKGAKSLAILCVYPVVEGVEIYTSAERVCKSRQLTLELALSDHRMDCLTCSRNSHCELLQLAGDLGIGTVQYANNNMPSQIEASAPYLIRDNSKCVLCRRCTAVCHKIQEVSVTGPNDRDFHTHISRAFDRDLAEVDCVSYGQHITACSIDALSEKDGAAHVLVALDGPTKHMVVDPIPFIQVTLGECFGLPIGTNTEGEVVTALRRLGFDKVFNVDITADFTILEEGTELLSRLNGGSTLPSIISYSPGWVRYLEQYTLDMVCNISSCKFPQWTFGPLVKAYYAEQADMNPQDVFVMSIMPCTTRKYEVLREEQRLPNDCMPVDVSLTTREPDHMTTRAGPPSEHPSDGVLDPMLGVSADVAVIFGVSGGVMEVVLCIATEQLTDESMAPLEYQEVRGTEGVKEANYGLSSKVVRVRVASGLYSVKRVLDGIRDGFLQYDFVELTTCPGGCISGGDQPIQHANVCNFTDIRALRAIALYKQDEGMAYHHSHENSMVQRARVDFLGESGDRKAHALLHCSYIKQKHYRVQCKTPPRRKVGEGFVRLTAGTIVRSKFTSRKDMSCESSETDLGAP